jgi:lipopolysaccharide/colanic/teichoic acid biosynthesis glycosyltransferase
MLRLRKKFRILQFRLLHWWHKKSIRLFDIGASASLLLILLPFLPLLALLIKSDSSGPLFFIQKRVGKNGKPFNLVKFRSMYSDAEVRLADLQHLNEKKGGIMFKIKNDPRITKIGKVMRRLSIDELPQIWNVLCGDMSVVGPRPALYREVEQYNLFQRERLEMKPGLTSEWVIKGRNNLTFEQQAALDIKYYYRHTLWQNVKIVIRTIPALLSGRGAS